MEPDRPRVGSFDLCQTRETRVALHRKLVTRWSEAKVACSKRSTAQSSHRLHLRTIDGAESERIASRRLGWIRCRATTASESVQTPPACLMSADRLARFPPVKRRAPTTLVRRRCSFADKCGKLKRASCVRAALRTRKSPFGPASIVRVLLLFDTLIG